MKNAYAAKLAAKAHQAASRRTNTAVQMAKDAAMIAANEALQMGPGRAEAFSNAFDLALVEIAKLTVGDTPDMEYTTAKVDQRLEAICGDKFQPWDERYQN